MADATTLLEKVNTDVNFRDQLSAATSPEEARTILASGGIELNDEQYAKLKQRFESGELSEDDLERVAGAGQAAQIATCIAICVGAAVAVSAAAAAF